MRPPRDYSVAIKELMLIISEKNLYAAALKKDEKEVAREKAYIENWGEATGQQEKVRRILELFNSNSK